jgi:pimeloyl-ACP methyl ester carboxylesterase
MNLVGSGRPRLWVEQHGTGQPALLLLHGLAGTGRVWDAVVTSLDGRWPGRIVVPDLPGHGRSDHGAPYSYGAMAADVAAAVGPTDLIAVGHSLGGVVALTLATGWFACRVTATVALSVKVAWSDDDLARAAAVAAKPPAWFDAPDEAVERYLRVAGLTGLVPPDSVAARAGVVGEEGRFRLAHDPSTAAIGVPDVAGLVGVAGGRVRLGCGDADPMVSHRELVALEPGAISLAGVGHNPHLEAPSRMADLILAQLDEGNAG